jgi:iron complex transport system ATP-binding protein
MAAATLETAALLEVYDLAYTYAGVARSTFFDVSFSLRGGEVLAIMGANGAGKTTMIDCLAGLRKPTVGKVLLEGLLVSDMPERDRARVVAYVPQINSPTFSYVVRDYVALGCAPRLGIMRVPGEAEMALVDEALERLEITYLQDKLCTQISGGEFQQVQIARALVQQPQLILFDEPTNHLDYGNQIKILNIIRELSRDGIAVVLTTHNPDHVILLGGMVGILDKQGSLEVGQAAETLTEERLQAIYGVAVHIEFSQAAQRMACVSGALKDLR